VIKCPRHLANAIASTYRWLSACNIDVGRTWVVQTPLL